MLNLLSGALNIVSGVGVSAIVTNAVKATTPDTVTKTSKVCIWVGSALASAYVADKVSTWVGEQVNETVKGFSKDKEPEIVVVEEA